MSGLTFSGVKNATNTPPLCASLFAPALFFPSATAAPGIRRFSCVIWSSISARRGEMTKVTEEERMRPSM